MNINKDHIIFICICIGISLGVFFMSLRTPGDTKFEDAALGTGTVAYYAEDHQKNKVHYTPKQNPKNFLFKISQYLKNNTILYLGNSQSHSINQLQENDNTMSGYLFNELINSDLTFLTASIPNANLQEHYLMYNYFSENIPNLKLLVIPVFMDDLRESGIRESYFKSFSTEKYSIKHDNELAAEINKKLSSFKLSKDLDSSLSSNSSDFVALRETTQEIVEYNLNKTLKENFIFWKNRENIRGEYFLTLYKTRNTLLGISSQSTRNMIKSRYTKNFNALKLILEEANKNGTKTLLVIPPLRQDIKYPYNIEEYKKFKHEVKELSTFYSTGFVNIDNIIEGKYWGYSASTQLFKEKDYDFMHFQAKAHKKMANTLKPYILKGL